jgi:exopolysaccharide production protein ExoZ
MFYPAFSPLNFEILMGTAAALLIMNRRIFIPRTCVFIGCALIAFGAWVAQLSGHPLVSDYVLRTAFLAPAGFLIVYGLAGHEKMHPVNPPKWLLSIGSASYSIYLCHFQIIVWTFSFTHLYRGQINPLIWEVAVLGIILFCGLMIHHYLEKPILQLLRKKKNLPLQQILSEDKLAATNAA